MAQLLSKKHKKLWWPCVEQEENERLYQASSLGYMWPLGFSNLLN